MYTFKFNEILSIQFQSCYSFNDIDSDGRHDGSLKIEPVSSKVVIQQLGEKCV